MAAGRSDRHPRGDVAVARDGFTPALLGFLGGMALLGALTASAVITYSESATACPSLFQPGLFEEQTAFCEPYLSERRTLIRYLVVAGVALLAAGLLFAVRRGTGLSPRHGGPVGRWLGGGWLLGLVAPVLLLPAGVVYGSVVNGVTQESFGLPSGWLHLAAPLGAVSVCCLLGGSGLTRQSAMAAAAVSIPAMSLIQFLQPLYLHYRELDRYPAAAFLDTDTSAEITYNGFVLMLSGLPLVVALLAAAWLQNRGRSAPGVTVSLSLCLMSAAVTTVVFLPQVLPGYDSARGGTRFTSDGMQASLWLPLMTSMFLLALAVVGATRARPREPQG